jgi:hypothetical protein
MKSEIEELQRKIKSIENVLGGMDGHIGSVARTQLSNSATTIEQSEIQYGLYTGLCVETTDVWKQNRIRWFSPLFHSPKTTISKLPWANAVTNLGGFDDSGGNWVPPAGSTVVILFENGNRSSPYYIGTTWHRNRGPDGEHNWGINIDEYYKYWEGTRDGYLVGPDDGSQVFPPWNTENYNGYDLSSTVDFDSLPEAQRRLSPPHIYGFKTPEKHYIKMVDGDPKCNKKWKRFEIMSSCGNWMMMKDDHLHYAGQWAHPNCGVQGDAINCIGEEEEILEDNLDCEGKTSSSKILGGHPSTEQNLIPSSRKPRTKHYKSQVGTNPYFKHKQECKPYKGPNTPLSPVCDLPQTGIQIMSISGHTLVFDDSVEEPSGAPEWSREFDFGCNDHYVGRTYWRSATGHLIELSDVETPPGDEGSRKRGEENYIKILSATGNKIELNDHTTGDCIAGEQRGIHLQSTSNHTIDMCDSENEQCAEDRMDGGIPESKAKKAYVRIRTGYGLEMSFNDSFSQESTQQQSIKIYAPQKDNAERGPHIHLYQESPTGPGLVFCRVGGNYVCSTYDNHVTVVGDPDLNPSDLIETVSRKNVVYTKDIYANFTDKSHVFLAKEYTLLLAGQDCNEPPAGCGGCGGPNPCIGAVLVYDYCNGCIRISDRVFASTSAGAQQASIFQLSPFIKAQGC